jgi:AcrR family transcriptional regulator
MKQIEASELKRKKIGMVSKRLFLKNGYDNTTIRQIIKEAGISIGSLYNFFKNKEDILLYVYKNVVLEINTTTRKIAEEFQEPFLRSSMSIALQLYIGLENKALLGLYLAAFRSETIDNFVLHYRTKDMEVVLKDSGLHFSYDEIYHRILAMNGAVKALVERKAKGLIAMSFQDIYSLIVRMGFSGFNVPGERIDDIIQQTTRIMNRHGPKYKKKFLNKLSKDLIQMV